MKRLAAIACTATLAVAALAGCGSDDGGDSTDASGGSGDSNSSSGGGDYCDQVKDVRGDFADVSGEDVTLGDMRSLTDRIDGIADVAPSDISANWESTHSTMDDVVSQLEGTGIATGKPLGEAAEQLVKDNPDQMQKLAKKFQGIGTKMQTMQTDGEAIQKEVKDECGFDMDSGSSE